jgi:hypothetical protein
MRPLAWLGLSLCALSSLRCVSSDDGTLGALSGEWDVTFPSGAYKSGMFTSHGSTGTLVVVKQNEGVEINSDGMGQVCVLSTSRYEIAFEAKDGAATTTVSYLRQYDGSFCPDVPGKLVRTTTPILRSQRSSEGTSEFGNMTGEWSLSGGELQCTVRVAGSKVTGTCDGGGSFEATVAGGALSGTTSRNLEFAAERR